jgi:hypothetical protein
VSSGGTGQTSFTNGQLLIGNTTGNTLTKATLTAGTNVSITNGAGSITINATDQFAGTVTSVGGTGTVNGLTLTGTVTSAGDLTLGGTLSGVDLATQTTGTLSVPRGGTGATTLTGVVKGNGTSAFTAGTVALGSEVSGTLPVANGGTGQTSYTDGQLLIGNSTGNTLAKATLTAGTGISITNGPGSVTIASTGGGGGSVTSVDVSGGTTGLTTSGGPITGSGTITLAGTLGVANGGTGVTTSTGTGSVVLSNSPTLVTPTLGAASATSIANALGTAGAPSYTFTGDTNTGMWSPSPDDIAFSTAGSERVRVTSAGNVGIGTATPSALLNLYSATGAFIDLFGDAGTTISAVRSSTDATGANMVLRKARGTTASRTAVASGDTIGTLFFSAFGGTTNRNIASIVGTVGTYTSDTDISSNLTFNTTPTGSASAAERMRITSTGNVGIGTLTPSVRLDVNAGALGGTAGNTLDLSRSFGETGGNQRALTTTLVRNSNGSDWTTTTMRLQAVVDATSSTYVDFSPNGTHDLAFGSLGSERMRITSAGNVGIGTSTPVARLDLNGNTAQNIVAVAALDVDCTQGNFFTKTIAANSTFTFSNPPASRAYAFTLEIVHTSGTITWPTTVRWPGNTAPTLTTGRTHLITFVTDNGGTIWYGAPQTNYLV